MQIYIVRHAEARSNVADPENYPYRPEVAEYEDRDPSLTELGERQAELTGIRLSSIEFDAVLSSPLHCQIATANAIIRHQSSCKKLELLNDLFEVGTCDYSGMPIELLRSLYPDSEIIPSPDPDPSGSKKTYTYDEMVETESLVERGRRIERYLTEHFEPNAKVLLVSSGNFTAHYLIPALLRLPERVVNAGVEFHCSNCAIARIDLNKDGRRSSGVLINDTSHLDVDVEEIPNIKNS